ncbi:hypothetical protein BT63DRAFT_85356 [Microthyrium microscopicum]|uniref:Zn(2)-C6 fungal-type domain-containing protein n=1 Tax=Microthyrium microscopicum TaxID=703497 RepID=A0A6A6U1V2_9PEZI|nr:hypothetical protein BT63DRAFT_85356 [Microthyrium microscopicum]
MVGVGGRSKACKNCKRRRVKCDETRPNCRRCLKAKLSCGDWPTMTIIQFNGQPEQQPSTPKTEPELQIVDTIENKTGLLSSSWSPWSKVAMPTDDLFVSYTLAHLLRGSYQLDDIYVPEVDRVLSDTCFLALATSYFGNDHREQAVVQRGVRRYSSALKGLNEALHDDSKSRTYDVLKAVLLMATYEMLLSDNSNGWIVHGLGLERLIEFRGPESFKRMPDRDLFETSRPSMIYSAIVLHKNTILSQKRWKVIPWEDDLGQKDVFQYLIDILADCPQLLVSKDRMYTCKPKEKAGDLARALDIETRSLLVQLEAWKASWDASEGDYCSETPVSSSNPSYIPPNGVPVPFWTTNLYYNSLRQANAMAMYNACIIFLGKIIRELDEGNGHSSTIQVANQMYIAGIEICRSAEYHLHVMSQGTGSFAFLFPLRMAWDAVGIVEPAIGVWLTEVLDKIQFGAVGRWAIAGYLLNIQPPTPQPAKELDSQLL